MLGAVEALPLTREQGDNREREREREKAFPREFSEYSFARVAGVASLPSTESVAHWH